MSVKQLLIDHAYSGLMRPDGVLVITSTPSDMDLEERIDKLKASEALGTKARYTVYREIAGGGADE